MHLLSEMAFLEQDRLFVSIRGKEIIFFPEENIWCSIGVVQKQCNDGILLLPKEEAELKVTLDDEGNFYVENRYLSATVAYVIKRTDEERGSLNYDNKLYRTRAEAELALSEIEDSECYVYEEVF